MGERVFKKNFCHLCRIFIFIKKNLFTAFMMNGFSVQGGRKGQIREA